MKKLVGLALCVSTTIGIGSAAFAGERTGGGEPTPVGDGTAKNSLCAFSGLQDGTGVTDPNAGPGHVQTPHGEPDYDLYFPAGSASICQWLNNSAGHSNRPQTPPPNPEG